MSENDLDAGRPSVHQLDWIIRRLLGFGNLSVDLKQQALRARNGHQNPCSFSWNRRITQPRTHPRTGKTWGTPWGVVSSPSKRLRFHHAAQDPVEFQNKLKRKFVR